MTKLICKTIEIMGTPATIFGYEDDHYFKNLPDYAGQNSVYISQLLNLPSNATVIDVGANIGLTTVAAARCVTSGRVVAIEPSPCAFECLEKCVLSNSLNNVTIIKAGLGEFSGETEFIQSEFLAGSYVAFNAREKSTIQVKILTLDEIIVTEKLKEVNLIKIDVEGSELDVLRGANNLINAHHPIFVMEFNSFALTANRNISPRSLLDFILDRFREFQVNRDGIITTVSSTADARHFMYSNMVTRGCIDDIVFGG